MRVICPLGALDALVLGMVSLVIPDVDAQHFTRGDGGLALSMTKVGWCRTSRRLFCEEESIRWARVSAIGDLN